MSTREPIFAVWKDGQSEHEKNAAQHQNTHFEGNMIISDADFELLLPDDVLFWPVRVIFPVSNMT